MFILKIYAFWKQLRRWQEGRAWRIKAKSKPAGMLAASFVVKQLISTSLCRFTELFQMWPLLACKPQATSLWFQISLLQRFRNQRGLESRHEFNMTVSCRTSLLLSMMHPETQLPFLHYMLRHKHTGLILEGKHTVLTISPYKMFCFLFRMEKTRKNEASTFILESLHQYSSQEIYYSSSSPQPINTFKT